MSIFEPIFERLNERACRYVVVDGLAVVLRGHPRLTVDADLAIDLSPVEARKTLDALTSLGLRPLAPVDAAELADPEQRKRWIDEKGMRVFSLYDPRQPLRIVDLLVDTPLDFTTLWEAAELFELRGTSVRVASIPHLIELKQRSSRAQDRDDIEKLREIARRAGESAGG